MHQSTKRRFCRFVFLAGCVLPTLAVMAWACHQKLPSTKAAKLDAISRLLGVRVQAVSLATPTPGCIRLRQLTLCDIETRATLLAVDRLEVEQQLGNAKLTLRGAKISCDQLPQLAECFHRLLKLNGPPQAVLEASELSWIDDADPVEKEFLAGKMLKLKLTTLDGSPSPSGRRLVAALVDLDETAGGRAQLTVDRNRQLSPPSTRIVLDANGMAVPASLACQFTPVMPGCGREATFAGKIVATYSRSNSLQTGQGSATGNLQGVSLADFSQLPIDAVAQVHDLQIEWNHGRVSIARGVVLTGSGTIAQPLATAVQQTLYVDIQPAANQSSGSMLPFGQLGVQFDLSSDGLSLWGACPCDSAAAAPVLLDSQNGVLLGRPQFRLPVAMVGGVLAKHGNNDAQNATACLPMPDLSRR